MPKPPTKLVCLQCGGPHWAKGLCNTHYVAEYRKLHPDKAKEASTRYARKNKKKIESYQKQYRAEHQEEKQAYNKKYSSDPTHKSIAKERSQRWYLDNLEKARKDGVKRALAWAKANPEKAKARVRAWDSAHPEVRNARAALWRARKRGAEGKHTALEVLTLLKRQKGLCAVCRTTLGNDYHKDHIQPLAQGGSNWISNIQLLCPGCNHHKSSKDPIQFMQQRGFLL